MSQLVAAVGLLLVIVGARWVRRGRRRDGYVRPRYTTEEHQRIINEWNGR